MSVYYIRSPAMKAVKIGYAENARRRFCKIQADNCDVLILAAIEDGDRALEAARHKQFSDYQRRGEWFRFAGALADHINALPTPEPRRSRAKNPVADSALIDRVGSELITARFALTPQHLYNWRTRGIPVKKRIAFAKLCAERGLATPAGFFDDFEIAA